MAKSPSYKSINDDEIGKGLKLAVGNKALATKFWQPLTQYPATLILDENYSRAQQYLLKLLHKCKSIDSLSYKEIHKGNPYYFLGIASYMMNDFETATFFIDSSVSEDLRYGADAINNPKPSTRFLCLEGDKDDQAAKQLTQFTERKVQRALNHYNSMIGRPSHISDLTIPDLRDKFLFPSLSPKNPSGWRTLATAFISFFIEWDFRNEFFELRPGEGTSEPFYLHLFKGCVLFESLLKENPKKKPTGNTLGRVLGDLYQELGLRSIPKISATFKDILRDIPSADNNLETAICFSGKVRNTTGHRLSWDQHINQSDYKRLFEMIASSSLHTIACLY